MSNLIFEKSCKGRSTYLLSSHIPLRRIEELLPSKYVRNDLDLPSLGEQDVIRHYISLSQKNFCVDTNFYPLGSCTMKYNPKINEEIAEREEFKDLHPYQDEDDLQGALRIIYDFECILREITGMERFTFQPAAGAHGELTGMLIIKAYHDFNNSFRDKIIVPDSAHGTNPATASMCGYNTVVVKSGNDGLIDIDDFKRKIDRNTAAVMLTNPNTLGLFEKDILEISQMTHNYGALLYYDGANFNPLLGVVKPSLMGFDVIHLNLHKTFSTPHGSGGPGAAAVGVRDMLVKFLPVPVVDRVGERYILNYDIEHTIGRVRSFYGNFIVLVKAYAYILSLGKQGLSQVAHHSVVNANYIKKSLENYFQVASSRYCMHEVVFSAIKQKEKGATALDIAKRLIDYGIHPPTIYFPLIVREALMIEPTETESKETLDYFINTMIKINEEIERDIKILKGAPHNCCVRRVDETKAARQLDLRWVRNGD